MNHFMRVAVLSAVLASSGAWAQNLGKQDQKLLTDLALANMAEIETGKLALQKTQSERVKTFAQQMVDDHTKGLEEVRKVAASRNVTLPTELDAKHKAMAAKLEKMSGDKFDRSYMDQAGVKAHKDAHKLVSKAESTAQDSEVKALASRLQPTIHQHLNNAEQLNAAIKSGTSMGSSGTEGTAGSGSQSGAKPGATQGTSGTPVQDETSSRTQGSTGSTKPDSSTRPERR